MALRMLAGVVLVAGCFNPNVHNGGFLCSLNDYPACPDGYVCIHGRCLDAPYPFDASSPGSDLAVGGGDGDLAMNHSALHDLAGVTRDLAQRQHDYDLAQAPGDMAKPPADLAKPPPPPPDLTPPPDLATGVCAHAGTPCTMNSQCCSNTCDPTQGNICIGG